MAKKKAKNKKGKATPTNPSLYARVKAEAKRKFKVYPSAYANMYASGVCSGKIKPGGRKKAMGGGMIRPMYGSGGSVAKGCGKVMSNRRKKTRTY